jgi:hypothetical protein
MMISRILRWKGHVVLMGKNRNAHRILWGNLREIDHFELLGLMLKQVLNK